jgi:hypothetical protein
MCRHTHSILWSNLFSRWVLWLHCRVSAPSQFIGQSQRMYIDDLGIHSKDRNFMIAIKKSDMIPFSKSMIFCSGQTKTLK